ncbi:hypothetical protein NQ854_07685 [Rhodococcus ruber]|uniref:hypothetical protein n=1 Tax=Rhodococcus ruber TaxID=1830 RepID=UPI00387DBF2E
MQSPSDKFDFSEYSSSRDGTDTPSPDPSEAVGGSAPTIASTPDPFGPDASSVFATADVFVPERLADSSRLARGRIPVGHYSPGRRAALGESVGGVVDAFGSPRHAPLENETGVCALEVREKGQHCFVFDDAIGSATPLDFADDEGVYPSLVSPSGDELSMVYTSSASSATADGAAVDDGWTRERFCPRCSLEFSTKWDSMLILDR